jgi:hypothetical protein
MERSTSTPKPKWERPTLRILELAEVEEIADIDVAFAGVTCMKTVDF